VHVLVNGIPANYALFNATNSFAGTPYLTVPGGIPAGESVVVTLEFTRTAAGTLTFSTNVLRGAL
jgi:hypothetical protein